MTSPPDVYVELREKTFVVVANKQGRKVISGSFERPRPRWGPISGYLRSPEYRCLEIDGDGEARIKAMLCAAHEAGLFATFKCPKCQKLNIMDDAQAERFRMQAMEGSEGVSPAHPTVQ
jgi:hypothetical protein